MLNFLKIGCPFKMFSLQALEFDRLVYMAIMTSAVPTNHQLIGEKRRLRNFRLISKTERLDCVF